MSGLLLGIILSVCTCWFNNMVYLPPWLVSTDFGTCSYQCFLSNCTLVSLHMKCSCAHTLSCLLIIIIIINNNVRPTLWRGLYFTKSILPYLGVNAKVHVLSYYIVCFYTSWNVVGRFSRSRFAQSLSLLTLNAYVTIVLDWTLFGAPFSCLHIVVLILSSNSLFLQWYVLLQLFSLVRLRIVVAVQFSFVWYVLSCGFTLVLASGCSSSYSFLTSCCRKVLCTGYTAYCKVFWLDIPERRF